MAKNYFSDLNDYLSGRFPNIPEVVPNGFRKVTCLFKQGNPEMEGHELSVGTLSFIQIVL